MDRMITFGLGGEQILLPISLTISGNFGEKD